MSASHVCVACLFEGCATSARWVERLGLRRRLRPRWPRSGGRGGRDRAAEVAQGAGEPEPARKDGRQMDDARTRSEPTEEQVESRADSLAAEPGNPTEDPESQAHALLEESEERIEDPAARDPGDDSVIRRTSDEGATLPARRLAGAESAAVRSLRAAGALVLGKTRTAEFAYAAPGPTRNPHDPGHTPGGSSHGSAAGVAAGFFPLALGTQTIGSIIRPAAFCGVAGFVPTYGRIRADGTLHVSRSLDRVGLLASDAAGLELAAASLIASWHPVGGGRRPVLGVADGPFLEAVEPAARELFERQAETLAAAGYQLRRDRVFEDADEVAESLRRLMNGEFAREHAALFERYRDRYRPQTAGGSSRASAPAARHGRTCPGPT